ncbi:hypothetical protein [Myxococcus sp. RHSTA-1-4]|uniref:hypothetical protein n=1 Tax=Myxococcus sp. RHSTA-1-4 TaxID=2874601 RepID=UPI001CBF0200|nr:hypothetical protein [Myxococcus sp. RHSTA-1-4]MBZ4422017.1 hypothetical protein [Myxococcus sp. RHSTA-1-4]
MSLSADHPSVDEAPVDELRDDSSEALRPGNARKAGRARKPGRRREAGRGAKGGRPATNPGRWPRTYREMLRKAGSDVAAIVKANAWGRAHGVALEGAAELVERNAPHALTPAADEDPAATGPVVDVPFSRVDAPPAEDGTPPTPPADAGAPGAAAPELVEVVDPSVFPDLAPPGSPPPDVGAGTSSSTSEAPAASEAPPKPADSFMGEPADLVEGCARGPLFILGAIAEMTRGSVIDLTRPVERTLFKGTPVERTVTADPVTRMGELAGVAIARRVQAAAALAAEKGDAAGGKPSVTWELVPLGLAFGAAVVVPSAGKLKGAAAAVGGWFMRGAAGAAAGVSRLVRRGAR